jgi:hypothetical protein
VVREPIQRVEDTCKPYMEGLGTSVLASLDKEPSSRVLPRRRNRGEREEVGVSVGGRKRVWRGSIKACVRPVQ